MATPVAGQLRRYSAAICRLGFELLHRAATRHHAGIRHVLFSVVCGDPFLRTPASESPSLQNITATLAVLNAALYFAASYLLLEQHYRFELAWLSVALAAFFFAFTRLLQRRSGISGTLYDQLYLALGVGFSRSPFR